MKTPFTSLLAVLIFGAIIVSCDYYNESNPGDPSTISASNVSWARLSSELFTPRCAICHGQQGAGVDISDYNTVVQEIGRIQEQVLVRQSMPPDSPLTAYEQTLLTVWIANGTPY